jgi:hypothetical protein
VKSSVLVASLWLGVLTPIAFAADVSINGNVSQQVEASDNYFLLNSPSGYTVRPLSAVKLDVLAATPDTRYLLDSNYSYYKYLGPGAQDTPLSWGTPASEKFSIDHTDKLDKYNFAASWTRSDLAATILTQTGTTSGRGTLDTFNYTGGVTRALTRLDSISWSAQVTTVSYSDPDQTPYVDYATVLAWNHNLSATTVFTNTLNFDWLVVDDAANSQRLFWNPMTGVQSKLTPRLTFTGQIGAGFVNAYQQGTVPSIIPSTSSFQSQPGATKDWMGNFRLGYKLSPTTEVSLYAAQAIVPTVTGQLQKADSVGSTLNYSINHSSRLSFFAQFSQITSSQIAAASPTVSDLFSASANYEYDLTREWHTKISYTYRQRNDDTGLARSSTILLKLSRDFTLLGKPPVAVEKTLSEIAQETQERAVQALPGASP